MDPVGPWSAYASYNRLAGVPSNSTSTDLHHHLTTGGSTTTPTTTSQILPGGFLSPPPVGYETVFAPIFHHASSKPASHYVTQQRQALVQAQAAAASKQADGEYHQTPFFEQNSSGWQQNSPFGILPHESVVSTTIGKSYENFNAHFAAQSINHLNNLAAAKNVNLRTQSPQVIATTAKSQTTFYPVTDSSTASNNKAYLTTNAQSLQQSCIVSSSIASGNAVSKDYRAGNDGGSRQAAFISQTQNVPRIEKSFPTHGTKTLPNPQIQTKAQTKIYPDLTSQLDRQRNNDDQQNSPISFSIMDGQRLNYANSNSNNTNKRAFQSNYRHYQSSSSNIENDFQRNKDFNQTNSPDCNVVIPRRPSPLQAHSQASPIGHAPSPAYPLYNSPMNSTLSSPQSNNHVTPSSPLDVSVPRPTAQNNVAYSSVITRALNPEKSFNDRYERSNQNCWDERRKYNNFNASAANNLDIPNRQVDITASHQMSLQDLSSCRGDPMSLVKNLQQNCQLQQNDVSKDMKNPKRRKSNDTKDLSGRIPPPAHSSVTNQQAQNGAYFDLDRWNFPPPPTKIFTSQNIPQHQGLMVPHPHSHHPPPPIPYFAPFHLAPHHPDFASSAASVEMSSMSSYNEHNHMQAQQQQQQHYQAHDDQPKVVVPNIEEELNFLSEATPPPIQRPPQIQQSKAINPPSIAKPADVKTNAANSGFMSSYIKFLQGERDSSPPPPSRGNRKQTWARSKPINEIKPADVTNGTIPPIAAPLPPPPPPPVTKLLSQGDPQDDPRYFPLPKERKYNSFDSSDDGVSSDDDLFNRKVPPLSKDTGRERRKGRPCKPGNERKRKPRAKKDSDRLGIPLSAEEIENMPRREISKRAAKDKVNLQSFATKNDDEIDEPHEFVDSDSDPAWTPAAKEDGNEEVPLKKGKRTKQGLKRKGTRNILAAAAQGAGIQEHDGYGSDISKGNGDVLKQGNTAPTLEDNIAAAVAQQNHIVQSNNSIDHFYKPGEFLVIKADLSQQWPSIWRVDNKNLLQKFEPFEQNGQMLYKNVSLFNAWNPGSRKQYLSVPITYKLQNAVETIVEFARKEFVLYDPVFIKKAMKDSEGLQDNFEVYIQTLISQALDSNFLTEIFQEQDEYFLTNVKTIDDLTSQKKGKLFNVLRWCLPLQVAISTWPCFNVITEFSNNDLLNKNCSACGKLGIVARVLMYGQPYNSTTLEGCQPDNKIHYEKDFLMCRMCLIKMELLNQVTHQKYLMYIECAKRVADKRAADPHKDTTCILNELLADERWLNQLFSDVRSYWAEVDCIVHYLTHNVSISGDITRVL